MRVDIRSLIEDLRSTWAAREAAADAEGAVRLPTATVVDMRESGILGAPVPDALGGSSATLLATATALVRLASAAPATALALAMPLGNAATARIPDDAVPPHLWAALDEGRRFIATEALRGKILAVANSEPGGGGDLAQTRTAAFRTHDGIIRLSGKKTFATFGPDADYFLCAARWTPPTNPAVDGFFVARTAQGLKLDDGWRPLGMGPTASVGLLLEAAPATALLGFPGALEGTNARHWSTALFAAVCVGMAVGALDEAVRAAPRHSGWARHRLAECALEIEAAKGLLESVARDERLPLPLPALHRIQCAKTFAARTALHVAVEAATLGGGRCYRPDHPISRLLRDAIAGPLLRPPLPAAMDQIAAQLFPDDPV